MDEREVDAALRALGVAGATARDMESQTLDFKAWSGNFKQMAGLLADAVVCLVNAHGGHVVVRVDDRAAERRAALTGVISITLDLPPSQVGVNVVAMIVDGTNLMLLRQQIDTERDAARDAERKVAALTADLMRKLNANDVPLRDIGEMVGVSFQRVHQLLRA